MNKKQQDEKPYKDYYLIYSRKSTDDTENQKNSLAYQVSEGIKFAKREHLKIAPLDIIGFCTAGMIKERHTGFKEDDTFNLNDDGTFSYKIERPKFFRLVKDLKNGYFKGAIFLCWDRASRNKNDDSILRKLIKQGVDIRFVQTQYDSKSSAGELHMDVDGMFAQHYSRVISEKVCNQNKKLREEGICTYRAPVGYINTGDSKNKPIDPEKGPMVKELFKKYLDGTWSLAELAIWANKQGLTASPAKRRRTPEEMLSDEELVLEKISRPVTFNGVARILSNRFYLGEMRNKDNPNGWSKSNSHEALISEEDFDKVQEILKKKKVSIHYIEKINYPYRGMLRCDICDRVYTPYTKKGIDYYGARCTKECANTRRSINAKQIEDKVGEVISNLSFTDNELKEIDALVKNDLKGLEEKRQKELNQIERRKRKIREDLAYLRENKLPLLRSAVYTPEGFLTEETKLNDELQNICKEENASDVAIHEVVKDIVFLSELLKDAYLYYSFAKPEEKKLIIQKIFSELTLSGDTLKYKCINGFKMLERPIFTQCGR
ncbi:MAG: recombinase family protein [Candidatus Paceibacterota bacterium]